MADYHLELTTQHPGITSRNLGRKKDGADKRLASVTTFSSNIYQVASIGDCDTMRSLLDTQRESINICSKDGYSPMHYAARYNHHRMIEMLVEYDGDVNVDGEDNMKPLHVCAKFNAIASAKTLLSRGALVEAENKYGATPLYVAARRGHVELCELLISKKADVNHPDRDRATPLHAAAMDEHVGSFLLLLQNNANVFAEACDGETPLHYAAASGRSDILSSVLSDAHKYDLSPADLLTKQDGSGSSVLHCAVESGSLEAVKICLQYTASVCAEKDNHLTPLHLAAQSGYAKIVQFLLKNHATVNCIDADGRTPLHGAVLSNNPETIQCLINFGANINRRDDDHMTPLLLACASGLCSSVECLISMGASILATDKRDRTCLHLAATCRQFDVLEYLMSTNARKLINAADQKGLTPLHHATQLGNILVVTALVENGSIVECKDDDDMTPLHYAAEFGHIGCVEHLAISSGFANCRDGVGRTPLHLSAKFGHTKVVELLIKLGGDVTSRDDCLWTPLMHASAKDHIKTLDLLLKNNSAINDKDKDQNTPLHIAAINGHADVVKYLLEHGANILIPNKLGKTCLDVAIDNSQSGTAIAIIKNRRWMDMLNWRNKNEEPVMRKLIRLMPEAAQVAMDQCIEHKHDIDHPDHTITFQFRFIDPGPLADNHNSFYGLSDMVKFKRESLLDHPLTLQLIRVKWNTFGRKLYYLNTFSFIVYISLLTTYSVLSTQTEHMQSRTTPDPVLAVLQVLIACMAGIGLFKEVAQLLQQRNHYLDWTNILDWLGYITSIVFVIPSEFSSGPAECFGKGVACNGSLLTYSIIGGLPAAYWQVVTGAIAILLAWINMLLFLQRYSYGVYIVMFTTVLVGVLKVLAVYSFMFVAFGLGFHMLMQSENAFKRIDVAIVKCFVMLLGEIQYQDNFFNIFERYMKTDPLFAIAVYAFLIAFCILMTIVLMNLMVGLAIGDIEEIRNEAGVKMLVRQINYMHDIEARMLRGIRKRLYRPHSVVTSNAAISPLKKLFRKIEIGDPSKSIKKMLQRRTNSEREVDINDIETDLEKERRRLKELKLHLRQQSELVKDIAASLRLEDEGEAIEDMIKESHVEDVFDDAQHESEPNDDVDQGESTESPQMDDGVTSAESESKF